MCHFGKCFIHFLAKINIIILWRCWTEPGKLFHSASSSCTKLRELSSGNSLIFTVQIWEWHQSFYLTFSKEVNKHVSKIVFTYNSHSSYLVSNGISEKSVLGYAFVNIWLACMCLCVFVCVCFSNLAHITVTLALLLTKQAYVLMLCCTT